MDARPGAPPATPRAPWVWGLLGLLPFAATALGGAFATGELRLEARTALLAYAGLILSFLGGARWGLEIGRRTPDPVEISASMVPTVVAFLILLAPASLGGWRFAAMGLAMMGQWLWDVRAARTPAWYPRLRSVLTAGAVAALVVGLVASGLDASVRVAPA